MSGGARVWLIVAAVAGVLVGAAFLLRTDVQRFRIPTENMLPTLEVGDKVRANKDAYDDADPERGDIVVSHPPQGALDAECGKKVRGNTLCSEPAGEAADVFFVQRIVALPGDELRVIDGKAIVDGKPLDEPYAQECGAGIGCTFRGSITIPDDHFFVMGDNRGASDDSRFWGPIPRDQLVGRVDDCWPLGLRCEKTSDPG